MSQDAESFELGVDAEIAGCLLVALVGDCLGLQACRAC